MLLVVSGSHSAWENAGPELQEADGQGSGCVFMSTSRCSAPWARPVVM